MPKLLIHLLLLSLSSAQVLTPADPQKNPTLFGPREKSEPAAQPQSSSNENKFGATEFSFGDEIPLLNPSNETITVGGLTIPLGDNRIVKSRFEKYLNQPPEGIEEAKLYHETIEEIIDALTAMPGKKRDPKKVSKAYTLLHQAASYPGDAEICKTLAQTVYTSLQAKKDNRNIDSFNNSLMDRRKEIITQLDWMVKVAQKKVLSQPTPTGDDKKKSGVPVELASNPKFIALGKELAEIELDLKKHGSQKEFAIIQIKTQFQATMAQWLLQRRFHHVVIAAKFYNEIWQDGDQKLHTKKNATFTKLFSEQIGYNPTVSALESIAREAIKDTENAIAAVDHMMKQDALHSASMRLLEAYAIGEYLTPVNLFDFQRKQEIQDYTRNLSLLFDAAQARDWGRAHELTTELKKEAKDFPSSKAESAISANIFASNMAATQAEKQLLEGDPAAASSIQQATEIWPTNPKLANLQKIMAGGSIIVRNQQDFTRLVREQNYREVFKRRFEFFPVLQDSPTELAQLQEIVKNIGKIEVAIEKAKTFAKAGNSYAAWEELALLRQDFPNDPALGRQLEQLAPEVADFTKALKEADDLASRTPQQTGSAISHYLKARSIYPNSTFAKTALDKLINQTLGE